MPKNEQWSPPYTHTRDWSIYNERLVRRGEFYLSLDFIDRWDALLSLMNAGKFGCPFRYPEPFIMWMGLIHVFLQMPYRQMEGITWKLSVFIPLFVSADYTILFCWIKRLDLSLPVDPTILSRNVIIAVDSTGIKVTNHGERMREKWRVRRGWIKVHVMIGVKTNQILGLEVPDESVQDDTPCIPLLDQVQQHCGGEHSIHQILADGAYDRNEIFNTLEKRQIRLGIETLADTATRSTGSPYRAECVRERVRFGGYQEWAEENGYGMRWKVESVLSSAKRIFGESVRVNSKEGMIMGVKMKMNCYNMLVTMVE